MKSAACETWAAALSQVAAAGPPAPPKELDRDPVVELLESWGVIKRETLAAEGPRGLAGLVGAEIAIAKTIAGIQKGRETKGSEVAAVLAKGPVAVAKIRQGIAIVSAREVKSGACARCGSALAPDVVLRRRTEAGLDQPEPH